MNRWKEGKEYLKQIDWYQGRKEYIALIILGNIAQTICHWRPELDNGVFLEWMSRFTPLTIVILLYLGVRYHTANKEVFAHASARFVLKVYALLLTLPALGLIWLLSR